MKSLKTPFVLLLALLLTLSLCACGQTAAPADAPAPAAEETAAPEEAPAPAETPTAAENTAEEAPAPGKSAEELLALAETMVGKDVSELIEAIGEPISTDYAPSCLGPGEDGELVYENFTVYTYREGDTETVEEVYHAG